MNQKAIVKTVRGEAEKWSGVLEDATDALKDTAASARSTGKEIWADAQETGSEAVTQARGWVRQNPVAAILSGIVLGAVVARLFGSNRD